MLARSCFAHSRGVHPQEAASGQAFFKLRLAAEALKTSVLSKLGDKVGGGGGAQGLGAQGLGDEAWGAGVRRGSGVGVW